MAERQKLRMISQCEVILFLKFQIIHTVNDFSQSLLDILESRVMKRMSINHCEQIDVNKPLRIDADTKTGFNQNPVFVYSKLTYKLILIF